MAGFEGFGYVSPQEIVAKYQQQFQQALQSGDKNAMRAASAQQAAIALGGTPELRKAKQTETILREAYKQAPSTGDEVEDTINFYKEAQKAAIKAGLPEIALQATEKLAGLRVGQEERGRLQSAERRAEAAEARAVAGEARAEEQFGWMRTEADSTLRHLTNQILVDPQSLEVVARGNITDLESMNKIKELQQQDPTLVTRTESEFVDLSEAEKERKAAMDRVLAGMRDPGIAGRSSLYKNWVGFHQRNDNFVITADDFVDLLLNPKAEDLFAAGGETKAFLQKAATHARSFFGDDWENVLEEDFEKYGNSPALKAANLSWNTLSGEKKALIMEMGYALATSREGGRLTDQDVERAIISLGLDNPDPRAIAWTFGRSLQRQRDQYARSLLNSGVRDVPDVEDMYNQTLGAYDDTISKLETKYQIDYSDENFLKRIASPSAENANLNNQGVNVREVPGRPGAAVRVRVP